VVVATIVADGAWVAVIVSVGVSAITGVAVASAWVVAVRVSTVEKSGLFVSAGAGLLSPGPAQPASKTRDRIEKNKVLRIKVSSRIKS
jgi:hypothetical protein